MSRSDGRGALKKDYLETSTIGSGSQQVTIHCYVRSTAGTVTFPSKPASPDNNAGLGPNPRDAQRALKGLHHDCPRLFFPDCHSFFT